MLRDTPSIRAAVYPITNAGAQCGLSGFAWLIVTGYTLDQISDPRQKRDVVPAPAGALARVCAIPVKNFHWLAESESDPLHTGWDASEVQAQLPPGSPAVVVGDDENATLGLSVGEMIAWLWQAVQELSAKVA